MKYMGSKRWMLQNGLGELMIKESAKAKRGVDLFCGSGAVANFLAQNTALPVMAIDLQEYSMPLVASIISRNKALSKDDLIKKWIDPVSKQRLRHEHWQSVENLFNALNKNRVREYVERCREICYDDLGIGPIWKSYGGYYFSPQQAITFDYLLQTLPKDPVQKVVCQAAMIAAASRCAAAPGHTAQPFQPTETAKGFILESWSRDPVEICKTLLAEICPLFAQRIGKAYVGDAVNEAAKLKDGDLVFVDPPYSGVHYSRFYHVLETLAKGHVGPVSGAGRYPAIDERPQSDFSLSGRSIQALENLFKNLAKNDVTVIFTFPQGNCSNGLSGDLVLEKAKIWFKIEEKTVKRGKFSTLGGNKLRRASRVDSNELVILMRSK